MHRGADLLPLGQAVRWHGDSAAQGTQASSKGERSAEKGRLGSHIGQVDPDRGIKGKLLSPARRRACIDHVRGRLKVSERRVCRVLGQHRSTQRHRPRGRADEERLVADMIELTRQYGRYSYRRVAALLRDSGWQVNDKRIERLWRREGLKVPMKQPKRKDGSG